MSDDEKKDKKGSRPSSSSSSKSSKSNKSDKSHKSDKSDKSHKSDKSGKKDRPESRENEVEVTEQTTTEVVTTEETVTTVEEEVTTEEAVTTVEEEVTTEETVTTVEEVVTTSETTTTTQEGEQPVPAPPEAAEYQPEGDAEQVSAETAVVTESQPDNGPAPVPAEPEPVQTQEEQADTGLCREKSVLDDLTPEEIERFEALFETYATEDGGVKKLTKDGIKMLFRFMGEIVNEAIVSQWLTEEDKDVDGSLDFEEFCSLYRKRRQPEDKRREEMLMCVNQLFPAPDDQDDSLSLDKVSGVMKQLIKMPQMHSEKTTLLNDADIDDVIAKMDVDKNQKVSRQEFVNYLCSLE